MFLSNLRKNIKKACFGLVGAAAISATFCANDIENVQAAGTTVQVDDVFEASDYLKNNNKDFYHTTAQNSNFKAYEYTNKAPSTSATSWRIWDGDNSKPHTLTLSGLWTYDKDNTYGGTVSSVNIVQEEKGSVVSSPLSTIATFRYNHVKKDTSGNYELKDGKLQVQDGYHWYAPVLNNVQNSNVNLPISRWDVRDNPDAVHGESFNVASYGVGTDHGLVAANTTWARYHGVLFHSRLPVGISGEKQSSCYNSVTSSFYPDFSAWYATCGVCGEDVFTTGFNMYMPKEVAQSAFVLQSGGEIVITCPTCGGLENQYYVSHTCKGISPNKFRCVYDAGTNDPGVSGSTATSVWYYNQDDENKAKYNGIEVIGESKIRSCGYVRPGYTFKGWATTKAKALAGTIDYYPNSKLINLQSLVNTAVNDSSVTLYAVWGATEVDVTLTASDAYGNGLNDATKTSYSTKGVYQVGREAEKDSATQEAASNYTQNYTVVSTNEVSLPKGYYAEFSKNGDNTVTISGVDSASRIYSETYASGFFVATTNTEKSNTNPTYSNGRLTSITTTFGHRKDNASAGTIALTLKYGYDAITLPSATKTGKLFVGWYTDSAFTTSSYVGTTGEKYFLTANKTLYPRFSDLEVDATPVFFKNSSTSNSYDDVSSSITNVTNLGSPTSTLAVRNAVGASNIGAKIQTASNTTAFLNFFYKKATDTAYTQVYGDANGNLTTAPTGVTQSTATSSTQTYTVPSDGIYRITATGGQGANYDSTHTGGAGKIVSGLYNLKKGDQLLYNVGAGQASGTGKNSAETATLDGGGYTSVSVKRGGDTTTLIIAGGGGAGTLGGNGGNAGDITESTAKQFVPGYPGESGYAAGGAGYVPGLSVNNFNGKDYILGEEVLTSVQLKATLVDDNNYGTSVFKLSSVGTLTFNGDSYGILEADGNEKYYAFQYFMTSDAPASTDLNAGWNNCWMITVYGSQKVSNSVIALSYSDKSPNQKGLKGFYSVKGAVSAATNGALRIWELDIAAAGSAGIYNPHVHTKAGSATLKSGTALGENAVYSASGGCYTTAVRCDGTVTTSTTQGTISGYYCGRCSALMSAGKPGVGASYPHPAGDALCVQCHNTIANALGHCSHPTYNPGSTVYKCSNCGTISSSDVNAQNKCTKITGYSLTASNCADDEIISAKGGESYICTNTDYYHSGKTSSAATVSTTSASVGEVKIEIVATGVSPTAGTLYSVNGLDTRDYAAPDAIEYRLGDSSTASTITWDEPKSNGTDYNYMATYTSVDANGNTTQLNAEAITKTVESAIAGYYVYVDTSDSDFSLKNKIATLTNGLTYTYSGNNLQTKNSTTDFYFKDRNSRYANVSKIAGTTQYAHIAAVDVAGNVGPEVCVEIGKPTVPDENLCKVTFNTNKLGYQFSPTANIVPYSAGQAHDAYVTATGQNTKNIYCQNYYNVMGSSYTGSNGRFNALISLSYGKDFPTPYANTSSITFVGWNSASDGSGTWYAKTKQGTGSGTIPANAKEFAIYNITNSKESGQEYTLYAIWSDTPTVTTKIAGIVGEARDKYGNVYSANKDVSYATGASTIPWVKEAVVLSTGCDNGTGLYRLSQYVNPVTIADIHSLIYYVPGDNDHTSTAPNASLNKYKTIYSYGGDETICANGTMSKDVDSDFTAQYYSFPVKYNVQGRYSLYSGALSRQYSGAAENRPGYPGYKSTPTTTVKIDATAPSIDAYSVIQDTLDKHKISELDYVIGRGGLVTEFKVTASDYNNAANGKYAFNNDSSGIQGAYVVIYDSEDVSLCKTYTLNRDSISLYTKEGTNPLQATFSTTVDLYAEFPKSSEVIYKIYIVDNAGNVSKTLDSLTTTDENGNEIDGYPVGDIIQTTSIGDHQAMGKLTNFSIKTVIYNDEDEIYNVSENQTFFKVGDVGHVEVWTIGYVDAVSFDFGLMGTEAENEIARGTLNSQYLMGTYKDGVYNRTVPYKNESGVMIAEEIKPAQFRCYVDDVETIVTPEGNPELYQSLLYDSETGAPYASHYSVEGWRNKGTSVRIPPEYQLTQDGNKVNSDGTPQYKWEIWRYYAIGYKQSKKTKSSNTYTLYDTYTNDYHYRITHES